MGHGDHWAAIYGDVEPVLERLIPTVAQAGKPLGNGVVAQVQDEDGGTHKAQSTAVVYPPNVPLTYLMLLAGRADGNGYEMHSFYPLLREGIASPLKVEESTAWEGSLEGQIRARTLDGAIIGFFDPLYYQNQGVYRAGAAYNFIIAGLAYQLRKCESDFVEITEGAMLDVERESVKKEDPTADVSQIKSVKVYLTGATILLPSESTLDDWGFRLHADRVGYFEVDGIGFYRIESTLIKGEHHPLRAYIYASVTVLGEYRPAEGDDIEGAVWLQGYLQSPEELAVPAE